MKSKSFSFRLSIIAVVLLVAGAGALAQASPPEHLSGMMSDYTPLISTANPTGPWEMHGHWSLHLKRISGKADFSAFITMELSDYWIQTTNSDASNPTIRSAHTHHISMTDGTVSYDTSSCPGNAPPNAARFVVSGPAKFISANGESAPFEKNGPSMLEVCVTGGTEVQYANVTLAFTGPASGHFGTQPIHGVVRFPHKDDSAEHSGQ